MLPICLASVTPGVELQAVKAQVEFFFFCLVFGFVLLLLFFERVGRIFCLFVCLFSCFFGWCLSFFFGGSTL